MSKFTDKEIFDLLKDSIARKFLQENSAQSPNISDWRGLDISNFQEDLLQKTKSSVSEKWFYTYFKTEFKKLPRIDMLNLLAQYCGYRNWAQFVHKKEVEFFNKPEKPKAEIILADTLPQKISPTEKKENIGLPLIENKPKKEEILVPDTEKVNEQKEEKKKQKKWIAIGAGLVLLLGSVIFGMYKAFFTDKTYEFCFIDSDRVAPIKTPIEVTIFREGFTPLVLNTTSGCVMFESPRDTLKMAVSSPYHKVDTLRINLNNYRETERIVLNPDDYKVMLHYYSHSAKNLKERIKKLNQMIDDNALIYQVYDNDVFGVEILSKQQYINLMTLPTSTLKNYTLIESERNKQGKIVKLKFKIQQDETELP
ncbi:hypothetical protein [Weeksella sp. HMSC059D05]|uniref:hypothetical protein n=1 Tax=Weeksella sp. HMSC059D05 TaxID=1715139 RepID=UPI0008A5D745|nr:hypothetical protein [Weeksella sp. HMSC059D05]OFM82970.1 hypothetical protein HMPREF2660_02760 [Weeksella sp. HMSC059D05]